MGSDVTTRDGTGSRRRIRVRLLAPLVIVVALALLASGCVMNGAWAVTTPVQPSSGPGTFETIDCVGPTWCLAGGQGNDAPAVQTWNGSAWTVRSAPAAGPLGTGSVMDVACMAADRCVAVVQRPTAQFANRYHVVSWDGAAWSAVPGVPVLTSPEYVSQACFVGGCVLADYASGTTITWDGAAFSSVASPSPLPRGDIACVSADDCLSNGGDQWFAFRWDGATWTEVPGSSSAKTMTGLDCPTSTQRCVAIGHDDFLVPILLTWDGVGWTHHPVPAGAPPMTFLRDVSCASGAECIVLGASSFLPDSGPTQLAWNGSDWFVATAAPSTPPASYTALSCAALWCMAVGRTTTAPAQRAAATYSWTNT